MPDSLDFLRVNVVEIVKKKIGKDVQGGVLRRLSFLLLDTLVVMQRAMRHGIFEDNIKLGSRFSIFFWLPLKTVLNNIFLLMKYL